MVSTSPRPVEPRSSSVSEELRTAGRRTGFGVGIAVNAALLYIAHNVLDWGWFGFLTDEWDDVLGWVTISVLVSIGVYVVRMIRDTDAINRLGGIAENVTTFIATLQVWRVYPFDFAGYAVNGDWIVRPILLIVMIASLVGTIVSLGRLFAALGELGTST